MNKRIEELVAAEMALEELTQIKYGLERNRVWGGMEWSYVPIHPTQYLPLRDKLEAQIAALRQALAEPDMGIDRGAWDDVPDATKWVDELRGDETEREWVGLTDEEIAEGASQSWVDKPAFESAVWWAEEKLKEKNRG